MYVPYDIILSIRTSFWLSCCISICNELGMKDDNQKDGQALKETMLLFLADRT